MHSERLPLGLWAEIMDTVVYLKNRSPSRTLEKETPFEVLTGERPRLAHLRVVGCAAWSLILKQKRDSKVAPRARLCCFLGYASAQKAYKLWDPIARSVLISRDVTFDETMSVTQLARPQIALAELKHALRPEKPTPSPISASIDSTSIEPFEAVGDMHEVDEVGETVEVENPAEIQPAEGLDRLDHTVQPGRARGWEYEDDPRYARSRAPTPEVEEIPVHNVPVERFTTRSGRQWGLLTSEDYDAELDDYLGRPSQHEYHPSDSRIPLWSAGFSPHTLAVLAAQTVGAEPRSWPEALASTDSNQWHAAAEDEMHSLYKAKVFALVPRSAAQGRVITSKWVFKVKRMEDNTIERYKARLVARGFGQRAGIDYDETFAPVAKFQSIRLILALAAMHDLELHQMDVKTAFLYGHLEEDVFMEQPEGFEKGDNMVWKLLKSLYGLKQSPRTWYRELDAFLKTLRFTRTVSDHSIYVRNDKGGLIIVGVYVDDLTIAAARLDTLVRFKTEMSERYEMKDLGELHFILGLQVQRDRSTRSLHLNQRQYIDTVLGRFDMLDCKAVKSPLRAKTIMSVRKDGEETTDRARYLTALGSLMYAMLGTRPDLAYAVGLLGRFASDPSRIHWEGVVSVLKYLKSTRDLGITYSSGSNHLDGFSDADFATSDPDRRRVTSGYVFRLWGGAVSWQSKKQPSVSLATGDAEYVALAQAARELMWLRTIMGELGFKTDRAITLYGDNQASIAIARNPVGHTRSKQIDIRYHYLRELVERGVVSIVYTTTNSMLADGLTKPLPPTSFVRFLTMLGLTAAFSRSISS